ncbi:hypothetical protein IFM89_032412 [Coptis chinensis]|uniref:Small auxin up regulated protein n=1 Tax=Coptis chinensis TaxID=261450 RepID=A0A835I835_9MAGN|nr:hypothetical protein IFM89_032412 [Coptis chinensis]
MGIHLPSIAQQAKQILKLTRLPVSSSSATKREVPKGHFAIYVGETEKKRFVVPVSYLSQSWFQDLLSRAEEEFGYIHPMGGLTIPCKEDAFMDRLNACL